MRTGALLAAIAALAVVVAPVAGATQEAAAPPEATAPAESANRPPSISVVAAEVRPVAEQVAVTGTLVAREEVQVSADVEGFRIEEILVDAGDSVEAGQVLARLSTDTLDVQLAQNDSQAARADAAIAQAESQIVEAKASLDSATSTLTRTKTLAERGVVSQDALDQAVTTQTGASARLTMAEQGLSVAKADKALIEAQRREIELRRTKTEIKAPTAGLVLEKSARIGAIASTQSGALFRIARDGLVELDAEVIETDLVRVRQGQTVKVEPPGGGLVWGNVRLVSPEVNAQTRLGHVRIAFAKDSPLRVGSFARGAIEVARREGVTVPVAAVVTSGDVSTVQVVAGDLVETRRVSTGLSAAGFVEIVEGLEAGDLVVGRAGTFLRDGDRITPVTASEETAG